MRSPSDNIVFPPDRGTSAPTTGDLVRHSDRPVQRGPGVAVPGIEKVEDLGDKERPTFRRERRGVGAPEHIEPLLHVAGDVRVDRLRIGREEVGRVRSHLVQVDEDLRIPAAVFGDPGARLLLRGPGPVTVHVDQVVIETAARPRLAVLERFGIRIRLRAAAADEPLHVALTSVRILQRIDQHHHPVENLRCLRIVQQRAGDEHRGLGRGRLVAVHSVRQPGDRRRAARDLRGAGRRGRRRIAKGDHILADRLQRGAVLRRGDHRENERPVLVGLAELVDGDQIRVLRQLVEVIEDARVRCEALPELVAEELLGRGDGVLRKRGKGDQKQNNREAAGVRSAVGGFFYQSWHSSTHRGKNGSILSTVRPSEQSCSFGRVEHHLRIVEKTANRRPDPNYSAIVTSSSMAALERVWMPRRFIISFRVEGLSCSSSAAFFCTPLAISSDCRIIARS